MKKCNAGPRTKCNGRLDNVHIHGAKVLPEAGQLYQNRLFLPTEQNSWKHLYNGSQVPIPFSRAFL